MVTNSILWLLQLAFYSDNILFVEIIYFATEMCFNKMFNLEMSCFNILCVSLALKYSSEDEDGDGSAVGSTYSSRGPGISSQHPWAGHSCL